MSSLSVISNKGVLGSVDMVVKMFLTWRFWPRRVQVWLVCPPLHFFPLWPGFKHRLSWSCDWPCGLGLWWGSTVRYWSLMNLWQVHSTLPSSAIPFPFLSPSYFHHISDTPPFIPVPLVSSFVPIFPVSLVSIPMPPWSSCLSHIVSVVIKYNELSLIKKSIKTKRTKNRDQERPTHDAYTHPDDHLRTLVPATNQKKRAYRWRPTGTRTEAT